MLKKGHRKKLRRTRWQTHLCLHDGCKKGGAGGGVCRAHGKRCTYEGCTRVAQGIGHCRQHGGGFVACTEIVDGVRCTTRAGMASAADTAEFTSAKKTGV